MPDATTTAGEGTLALLNDAPPLLSYPPAVQAVMLPLGGSMTLNSTARIYEQGSDDDSCCAHSVASAMETWLVQHDQLDASAALIDPHLIFNAANHKRNLHRCCAAAKTVPTANGIERATTSFLGQQRIEQMLASLLAHSPLMVEIRVGSNFRLDYDGTSVYRATGTLDLIHAVCILGYGTDLLTGEPFWIAKNSYGDTWGDRGHAKLLWGDPSVRPEFKVFAMRSVTL